MVISTVPVRVSIVHIASPYYLVLGPWSWSLAWSDCIQLNEGVIEILLSAL